MWHLYKTEDESRGVSTTLFCVINNIPYTVFYDWFKKIQRKIVLAEVEGIPEKLIQTSNEQQHVAKDKFKRTFLHKGSTMETIETC